MPLLTEQGHIFYPTQIPVLSLTQIPLDKVFKAHTDLTDLTGLARLVLNLTEALRGFAP